MVVFREVACQLEFLAFGADLFLEFGLANTRLPSLGVPLEYKSNIIFFAILDI